MKSVTPVIKSSHDRHARRVGASYIPWMRGAINAVLSGWLCGNRPRPMIAFSGLMMQRAPGRLTPRTRGG
jgi:hypothetical protein